MYFVVLRRLPSTEGSAVVRAGVAHPGRRAVDRAAHGVPALRRDRASRASRIRTTSSAASAGAAGGGTDRRFTYARPPVIRGYYYPPARARTSAPDWRGVPRAAPAAPARPAAAAPRVAPAPRRGPRAACRPAPAAPGPALGTIRLWFQGTWSGFFLQKGRPTMANQNQGQGQGQQAGAGQPGRGGEALPVALRWTTTTSRRSRTRSPGIRAREPRRIGRCRDRRRRRTRPHQRVPALVGRARHTAAGKILIQTYPPSCIAAPAHS